MLFNSFAFALFLPIVFAMFWLIPASKVRSRNVLLLIASYVFYGWWDARFLLLIFASSIIDFTVGKAIETAENQPKKKKLLALSLIANLGMLGFFKYFNFFVDSAADVLTQLGMQANYSSLEIILPVGISFYTFQTLSYTIDVYRGELKAQQNPLNFLAFVSFFPQLVAGPIERAKDLLPQFNKERSFEYANAVNGARQMLWGLFKKVVIADNCAPLVNQYFESPESFGSAQLALGAVLFAFQIYGDFSGYSDLAIGSARLFGFELKSNFLYPYFSRNIAEFWRRWHISLSTWFRDYLYIPLGGSKGDKRQQIRNVFVIFLVSGFWHGANWTFVFWGALHALFFLPLLLMRQNKAHQVGANDLGLIPTPKAGLQIVVTFALVTLAWIFFRADNISEGMSYCHQILTKPLALPGLYRTIKAPFIIAIVGMLAMEWIQKSRKHGLAIEHWPTFARWTIYMVLLWVIFMWGSFAKTEFIYFAF